MLISSQQAHHIQLPRSSGIHPSIHLSISTPSCLHQPNLPTRSKPRLTTTPMAVKPMPRSVSKSSKRQQQWAMILPPWLSTASFGPMIKTLSATLWAQRTRITLLSVTSASSKVSKRSWKISTKTYSRRGALALSQKRIRSTFCGPLPILTQYYSLS